MMESVRGFQWRLEFFSLFLAFEVDFQLNYPASIGTVGRGPCFKLFVGFRDFCFPFFFSAVFFLDLNRPVTLPSPFSFNASAS